MGNSASIAFPDSITFRISATSAVPVQKLELEFWTKRVYSCATSEYSSVRLEMEPGTSVDLSWDWEMKKTGSIPPGTTVWWRWRVEDESGRRFLSTTKELSYDDERFQWNSYQLDNIQFHWYEGGPAFGQVVADAARGGLASLQLGRELVQPIDAFIYPDSEAVRGAVLFAQEWTGGLAFGSQNILLITVDPDEPTRDSSGVVHELAHLLVNEVTANCLGDLPRWLSEGLATYAEGPLRSDQQESLSDAIAGGGLVNLRSLNSSFPAAGRGATLAYAQSRTVVGYLIDTYGWEQMRELLAIFQAGSTYDDALRATYGMDTSELDAQWRATLALQP